MAKNVLVFAVFLVLAIFVTWPLATNLNHLIIDQYDGLLITWIQNWWLHSRSLSGNIFYPYHATLAFSDYHLISSLLAAPFIWLTSEPLVGFNVNLILGLTLTGFASYKLVYFLTKRDAVSFFFGVLLSFSTVHLNYLAHPQIFHLWLLVFPILFLFQKRRNLFVCSFILAAINSPLNLYFLLFFAALLRKHVFWFVLGSILSTPFLLPYFWVSRQFNYTRPITDAINFSLQLPDLANISIYSRLSYFIPQSWGTPAYFGTTFLILLMATLLSFFKHPKNDKYLSFWLWSATLSFILALGPALHIFRHTVRVGPIPAIPLPYAVFYYIIPGFSGFRTPSRWIVITFFSLTMVIAIRLARKFNWLILILLSLLVLLEVNSPLKYYQIPSVKEFPPEQVWLKDHYVGAPIIQFPIYGWFDGDEIGVETLREYYSTSHWHPMYNGYSGFSPTEWENQVRWLQKNFPSEESISWIKNTGIKLILVPRQWEARVFQLSGVKLVQNFSETSVFEIL